MIKDYVICHGDPFALFQSMVPEQVTEWHTHPLAINDAETATVPDHIAVLYLSHSNARDTLEQMEAAGHITLLPTLTGGQTISADCAKHPGFIAAGIDTTHRMWDAAKKLHARLQWRPLHPDR